MTLNTTLLIKVAAAAIPYVHSDYAQDVISGHRKMNLSSCYQFIAESEAKAAERGWYVRPGINKNTIEAVSLVKRGEPPQYEFTEAYPRDPTDPISTANAKILCLAEVFNVKEIE